MSWLFWVLLILVLIFAIQGFRKGLIRTTFAMFSFVVVLGVTTWITPYISDYIGTHTRWEQKIQQKCENVIEQGVGNLNELSLNAQISYIEELPLPQIVKDEMIENNNNEIYKQLSVASFGEYVAGYVANGIINGITFVVSFIVAVLLMQLILFAVDMMTELPVVGLVNRLGGFALGLLQGIIWIWVIFLIITVLCNTVVGSYLIETIKGDKVLSVLYNSNLIVQKVMKLIA